MSDIIKRVRGDNYPIGFNYLLNNEAVDLTDNELKFSFVLDGSDEVVTIIGSIDVDNVGRATFEPTVEQMGVAGQYSFDFQRIINGVVYTHATGTMLLSTDVTP